MRFLDLVAMPVRLTVATVETTLSFGHLVSSDGPIRRTNGYADRVMLIIGEDGLIDRLTRSLSDPDGPMRLVSTISAALDADRPLGRAVAPGGTLDRLLAADGPLYRLVEEGGTLDRLVQEEGLLERLLSEEGFVEKLTADGGTLDQLVALGETFERIQPRLAELTALIPELHHAVTTLNQSVGPLGELANRLPMRRRPAALEG